MALCGQPIPYIVASKIFSATAVEVQRPDTNGPGSILQQAVMSENRTPCLHNEDCTYCYLPLNHAKNSFQFSVFSKMVSGAYAPRTLL